MWEVTRTRHGEETVVAGPFALRAVAGARALVLFRKERNPTAVIRLREVLTMKDEMVDPIWAGLANVPGQ